MTRLFSRLPARLALDAAMVLLFITALAFRATGRAPHEWTGLALCFLFGVHAAVNRRWYAALCTGRYSSRRILNTAVNLALVAAMAVLCVTGILNSRHIFAFSHYVDGESIRRLHTFTAYWGLVLIGAHAGLHWETIAGALRKAFGPAGVGKFTAGLLRPAGAFLLACGVWASFDRDMGAKLFLGFSFDYWDPDRPLVLFYVCHLAIMGVYAFVAHCAQKGLKRLLYKEYA